MMFTHVKTKQTNKQERTLVYKKAKQNRTKKNSSFLTLKTKQISPHSHAGTLLEERSVTQRLIIATKVSTPIQHFAIPGLKAQQKERGITHTIPNRDVFHLKTSNSAGKKEM